MHARLLCLTLATAALVPATRAKDFVFAAYNLENYFTSESAEDSAVKPLKSPRSISALVQIMAKLNADVIGLSEVGSPKDLEHLRKRLLAQGRDYPEPVFLTAAEGERNLALLSRVPIVSRQSATDVIYEMQGTLQRVRRGFLDVTVQATPEIQLRLVGAHLKSRLTVNSTNEALERRREAALLRRHVDQIFAAEPKVRLLVWGDLNDVKNSAALAEIMGPKRIGLVDLVPADKHGDRWTWQDKTTDTYQRIDYLLASKSLKKHLVREKTRVDRSVDWRKASDHRAVVGAFRFPAGAR